LNCQIAPLEGHFVSKILHQLCSQLSNCIINQVQFQSYVNQKLLKFKYFVETTYMNLVTSITIPNCDIEKNWISFGITYLLNVMKFYDVVKITRANMFGFCKINTNPLICEIFCNPKHFNNFVWVNIID
jgi:hypothetical protein